MEKKMLILLPGFLHAAVSYLTSFVPGSIREARASIEVTTTDRISTNPQQRQAIRHSSDNARHPASSVRPRVPTGNALEAPPE
jgi:hypothetical protein